MSIIYYETFLRMKFHTKLKQLTIVKIQIKNAFLKRLLKIQHHLTVPFNTVLERYTTI